MKRFLIVLLLLLIGCTGKEIHTYQATDSRIQIMGRHLNDEGRVKFGASGVSFFITFKGSKLDVKLLDEFKNKPTHNWFTVSLDGKNPFRFHTDRNTQRYTLADSLKGGTHHLVLTKDTEGQNGHNTLEAVYTNELLPSDSLPERKIEYIGDSITAGYGDDTRDFACKKGQWFDHTNARQAYGPLIAQNFNAQWMLSSVSGMGMHRNWNTPSPVMPDVYSGVYMEYTDSVKPWNFSQYTPDLVVIALGTNDFSDGDGKEPRPTLDGDAFVSDYASFIEMVHKKYPNAKFLLSNSPMLDQAKKKKLGDYLQQIVQKQQAVPDSSITTFAYSKRYTSGCGGHPNMQQQQTMASELEPKIKNFMHW